MFNYAFCQVLDEEDYHIVEKGHPETLCGASNDHEAGPVVQKTFGFFAPKMCSKCIEQWHSQPRYLWIGKTPKGS